jgi:hypothetical protein
MESLNSGSPAYLFGIEFKKQQHRWNSDFPTAGICLMDQ